MHNLFVFLRKNYFYFLFFLLESASLALLVNHNDFQKSQLCSVSAGITGGVNSLLSNITEYFSLRKTNEVLVEELARLHSRIPEAFYVSDKNVFYRKDTIVMLEYKYLSAKVISNSTNKRNNFLMINKGTKHGIVNHMGVVIGNTVVGQVVSVSDRKSVV